MVAENVEYGDPESINSEILRTVVGSGVHGLAIPGTDDHDEMGIYIPKPEHLLGVSSYRDDYISRTQPEGARSGPGDTDLVIYSLRKYLRLAVKGNPTALTPLFAPEEFVLKTTSAGEHLRLIRDWFLSEEAIERFLGYMHGQHERMMGRGKQNRVPNRPELIEKYGWDTKYGSHALRLAYQGHELATTGTIVMPMEGVARERVLDVKLGKVPREEVSAEITDYENKVRWLLDGHRTVLPLKPNVEAIENWSVLIHLESWGLGK
jgi:predicted nucleotidyltransferase